MTDQSLLFNVCMCVCLPLLTVEASIRIFLCIWQLISMTDILCHIIPLVREKKQLNKMDVTVDAIWIVNEKVLIVFSLQRKESFNLFFFFIFSCSWFSIFILVLRFPFLIIVDLQNKICFSFSYLSNPFRSHMFFFIMNQLPFKCVWMFLSVCERVCL